MQTIPIFTIEAPSFRRCFFVLPYPQLNHPDNPMNLIKKVRQSDRLLANYVYLSDGRKLMAVDSMSNGLSYIGSLVYTRQNGKLRLESTGFSGGRIVSTQTSGPEYFEPRYFFTDHLGSVRAITDMDGNVLDRSDYYPFGMRWNDAQNPVSDNRYRYNGKEEQAFVSVPYTDYGARMYNPKLGRWFNVDPLAEKYYPISPYAFCVNNPMKYVDPNGMEVNVSELNEQHLRALLLMLSTQTEFEFVSRYMAKGSSMNIGGKTFKFDKKGDRSKDVLWLRTSDIPGVNGRNSVYTKKNRAFDDDFNIYNSNIVDGVFQVIDLNSRLNKDQAAGTLGHEAFVHTDKDADALNEMDQKVANGTYSSNPNSYESDAQRIVTSSVEEHRALGRGEVKKYEKYSKELVNATGNPAFLQMYKKDVKNH